MNKTDLINGIAREIRVFVDNLTQLLIKTGFFTNFLYYQQ